MADQRPPTCPKCGDTLAVKRGKHGEFLGCVAYPMCNYTEPIRVKNADSGELWFVDPLTGERRRGIPLAWTEIQRAWATIEGPMWSVLPDGERQRVAWTAGRMTVEEAEEYAARAPKTLGGDATNAQED